MDSAFGPKVLRREFKAKCRDVDELKRKCRDLEIFDCNLREFVVVVGCSGYGFCERGLRSLNGFQSQGRNAI